MSGNNVSVPSGAIVYVCSKGEAFLLDNNPVEPDIETVNWDHFNEIFKDLEDRNVR